MPVITLLSDFGLADEYVGLMKGVILSINPFATIVDMTHHIDPQDLHQAAWIIHASFRYFPEGTVHIVVVDPGVGSDRAIIAFKHMGHRFVAPNNGVMTLVLDEAADVPVIRVDNQDFFLKSISRTFHGRDIFAPVGAHIAGGVAMENLGDPMPRKDLVRLDIEKPFVSKNAELVGAIIWIDRFGNLITNIDAAALDGFCRSFQQTCGVVIGTHTLIGISKSYAGQAAKSPLAIIGSRGYLEIAVNCGNARDYFNAGKGDRVRVVRM